MAFVDNIRDIFGIEIDEMCGGIIITTYLDKGVHIEGSVKVAYFSDEEILLKGKKDVVSIKGKHLSIYEINAYDIYIVGKVDSITRGGI